MLQGQVARYCELFFVGLLAGLELAVHYAFGAPPSSLPEDAQIVLRQTMIRRLRILAPAIFFACFLAGGSGRFSGATCTRIVAPVLHVEHVACLDRHSHHTYDSREQRNS